MASKPLIRAVQKNVENFIQKNVRSHSQRMSIKTSAFAYNPFENSKNKIHSVASICAVPTPPRANPKMCLYGETMSSEYLNPNCVKTAVSNDGNIDINDWSDLVTFGVVYASLGFILCKFL
eukprot:UN00012